MVSELIDNDLGFAFSQQSIVNQNAGKLRPNRLEQQRCDYRGINSARQTADHLVFTHLFSNSSNRLICEIAQLPCSLAATNFIQKVLQERRTMSRMRHFGVKLQSVDRTIFVFDGGHWTGIGPSYSNKILGNLLDLISMAHPDLGISWEAVE